MFAKPRPKKSVLPPPPKKRKIVSAIESVDFDPEARNEYLTGFHKRKQQRVKHAQEQAAKQARQDKLEARKQLREQRRREVEQHIESVNKMLQESEGISDSDNETTSISPPEDWNGFPDKPDLAMVDHQEEYVDEDRFTSVTVQTVSISRGGFQRPGGLHGQVSSKGDADVAEAGAITALRRQGHESNKSKKPKGKFRYESKIDRQMMERKQRIKARRHH